MSKRIFIHAYSDGYADETIQNGGVNVSAELEKLDKLCTLQRIPEQVGIPGNETADRGDKEGRDLNDEILGQTTLYNANAKVTHRFKGNPIKVGLQI
ncbi:hypothetical protein TNIN_117181 [Trichonephila inaurata madagascariensis]|uniref:Uncharacterized protein n=1 Tax=Trichonephila inaurata madagascariensis TaxID=2747483 RepID=A0A8X7BQ74_9ARAC|nr:hypothetical protein TNIN_117181 [Trichonephila inaurata madagascariensis]